MEFLVHTDFGHDPDDAIALAYLIEHGVTPNCISITPGAWEQELALTGFLESYFQTSWLVGNIDLEKSTRNAKHVEIGKHKIFYTNFKRIFFPIENKEVDKALIIGPAKNVGGTLNCKELYFQGGYSPNSIVPLPKFRGKQSVPSFNPNGARKDFDQLLTTQDIEKRYYIGKNICHGFTKERLSKIWEPKNVVVKKFWNQLKPTKAMHDVLAAIMFINKDIGIWEQAEPTKLDGGWTTVPTDKEIYTLIGVT